MSFYPSSMAPPFIQVPSLLVKSCDRTKERQRARMSSQRQEQQQSLLRVTPRLREAAQLMNKIPNNKFPLLLSRILSKIHLRDGKAFTADEEAQLQSIFGLTERETRTVVEASKYIFEQAAYGGVRGDVLKAALLEAEVDEGHAQVATLLWETQSLEVINKLRQRSMGGPKVLSHSDWHLQLVTGESGLSQGKDVATLFDLTTSRPDVNTNLYNFFLDLERIQEQLDHLS